MELKGSTAILTGASRGIGSYLAEGLAARGVNLGLVARSRDDLEEVTGKARAHGVKAIAIVADVTKKADLKRIVSSTRKALGPIDILINNAGTDYVAHFARLDPSVIESMIKLNLIAPELLTREVVPEMIERGRGHIVNMSSLSGKAAAPYMAVYSSTKHGLVGFSWSLRAELAEHGVGVSVICPGYVTTGVFMGWNPSGKTARVTPTVSPDDVVRATLEAIEENRAEVIVTKGLGKISDISHAVSVDGTIAIARKQGAYDLLKRVASEHTPSEHPPSEHTPEP